MDKLEELIKKFREELSALPLIKEYNEVARKYRDSQEIKDLIQEQKTNQTKMIMARENKRPEEFEAYKRKWKEARDKHVAHPLYQNYTTLKREVGDLLAELNDILNDLEK